MKKTFLCLFLAVSFLLCSVPVAYANDVKPDVTFEFTQKPPDLFVGERIAVSVSMLNSSDRINVKACWKFDGKEIAGYSNPNFVLEQSKTSTLHFTVPDGLSLGSDHTISFELTLPDGTVLKKEEAFWLNSYIPYIHFSFTSAPVNAEENSDTYLTVTYSVERENRIFSVPVICMKNGEKLPEYCGTIDIYDGMTQTINVGNPGPKGTNLNVSYVVNPDGIWGIDQWSQSAVLPVINSQYEQKAAQVLSKINPVIIPATTTVNTAVYADSGLLNNVGSLPKGEPLTYLNPDSGHIMRAGRVRTQSGQTYWVPLSNIYISQKNFTIADNLTAEEKEIFVNYKNYDSKTYYLVWVNLERQIVNIYLGSQGNWKILKTFPCATGKNATPTPTGIFEYTSCASIWKFDTFYCAPVLNLRDGYAFHCQPTAYNGNVADGTMGRPASLGCIRMYAEDVTWMRDWVPVGTKVVIL